MLLGRRGECATLDEVVGSVRRGESRALAIGGEAGIGKSALLDYLVSRASDCRVVRIAGIQSEAEVSFAALHQLCGPMLNRLDRLPTPQRGALETVFGIEAGIAPDRLLVGLAVLSLLAETAEERPLVCVIDDAHWLDRASAQAIAIAARRLVAESVAVVFAYRTSEQAPQIEGLPRLTVEGLDDRSAKELLHSVVPVLLDEQIRDRIIAETQGNPLAILELPRGLTLAELASGLLFSGQYGFTDELEASFARRVRSLPQATRQLLLVAAAESFADVPTVRRAAQRLGIDADAAVPAVEAGLWEYGASVRFRHPLVRSAVYRGASVDERRIVHAALADATDSADRRAWHRAEAAVELNEELAAELERSAGGAQQRGGFAQAVAFLQQASRITPNPAARARRELATARAAGLAGDLEAASLALSAAQAGPLDDLGRVHADLVSAQIASASNRGSDAALLLMRAAKAAEPLDPALARETYLQALTAATFAGRLPDGIELRDFAEAARAAPSPSDVPGPADLMLDGLAHFYTSGLASAAPLLRRAIAAYRDERDTAALGLPWLSVAVQVTVALWDDVGFEVLSERYLDGVRAAGALSALPIALDYRVFSLIRSGELSAAAALVEETTAIAEAIGHRSAPYGALALLTSQGRVGEAQALIEASIADARSRGVGVAVALAQWELAVLRNGLGRFDEALEAAREAARHRRDLSDVTNKALVELIEAAVHAGRPEDGADALRQLSHATQGSGTDWALGVEAQCRALLSSAAEAEPLFREAIARLGRTHNRPELARAHLLYGEWLRRERRRLDARDQLRAAHELFLAIGMSAFADRAARELRVTGAAPRKHNVKASGELTAQEAQVARLASEGLSNPEIASRLFLSPHTVEYHLRKVFAKLRLRSRKELGTALRATTA